MHLLVFVDSGAQVSDYRKAFGDWFFNFENFNAIKSCICCVLAKRHAAALGGLPFLAPFHTLVAWAFVAFIIAHVYLTTTGHTPMAGIKSMIVGWDDVEVHSHNHEEEE